MEQVSIFDLFPEEPLVSECTRIALALLPESSGVRPTKGLVASIAREGVRDPVHISHNSKTGEYRVVSGKRRVWAAREAGLEEIPACIYEDIDLGLEAIFALEGNALRSNNPLDELGRIDELMNYGFDESVIAKATGLSVATIRKRRQLHNLIPSLRIGLFEGKFGIGVAEAIAKLPIGYQEELASILRTEDRLTMDDVKQVTRERKEATAVQLDDALFDAPEVSLSDVYTQLVSAAVAAVERANESVDAIPAALQDAIDELQRVLAQVRR